MAFADMFITIFVLVVFFGIIYSRLKDQSLRDTYEEIRDLINPMEMDIPIGY